MRVPKVTLTSHVNDGPPAETGEGRNSLSRIVAANDIRNILQITSSKGGEDYKCDSKGDPRQPREASNVLHRGLQTTL